MPQPKKRHNHSRTNRRRSHHALRGMDSIVSSTAHRLKKYYDLQSKKVDQIKDKMLASK